MPKNSTSKIKTDQRVFITGKTGSGKTYLARHLLSSAKRLMVLDPKGTLSNWNLDPWDIRTKRQLSRGEPVRTRILAPIGERNPEDFWDEVLFDGYEGGDVLIYIDELYGIIQPGKNPGPGMFAVYTRGRELGVGVIGVSQRPTWTPLITMSESDWFFCFRLQLIEDRKRVAAFMGPAVLEPPPDRYGFYFMESIDDLPIYVPKYTPQKKKELI